MTSDRATEILLEVMRGRRDAPGDTLEERAYRTQLAVEVDEIHAKGGTVEIPKELP